MRRNNPGRPALRRRRHARLLAISCLLSILLPATRAQGYELVGHVKPLVNVADIPADSLLQDYIDDPAVDYGLDLRLDLSAAAEAWSWRADYQLIGLQGDQLELAIRFPGIRLATTTVVSDERRLMDLTHIISEQDDRVILQRLDRLYLMHATEKTVVKAGRQAISWGNGVIFNPVDFINPFDPAAVDTEYKVGEDMLYAQYLLDSGNDLQGVWVVRRDADGDVRGDVATIAAKYHLFSAGFELDLLLAEHYDQPVAAIGGVADAGEALWRGDLMVTDTGDELVTSAVLGWSYSLVAWQRNLTTNIEYFYSGFGIDDGDYAPAALAANPELTERLKRGELFTLAQHYLAFAATLEATPLWQLSATLFGNLDDRSKLLQLVSRHDLRQDLQLLLALNLPDGARGTEYGGADSEIPGRALSVGASVLAELAWYF